MTEKQIEKMLDLTGWNLWHDPLNDEWRADQGDFHTAWRKTPNEVLADVRRMMEPDPHEGRNEDDPRIQER